MADHPRQRLRRARRDGTSRRFGARRARFRRAAAGCRLRFNGGKHPVYWIYGFKRGAFWPFIPTGEGKERDNAEELELKAKMEKELPVEQDLTRWLALFDAPI